MADSNTFALQMLFGLLLAAGDMEGTMASNFFFLFFI